MSAPLGLGTAGAGNAARGAPLFRPRVLPRPQLADRRGEPQGGGGVLTLLRELPQGSNVLGRVPGHGGFCGTVCRVVPEPRVPLGRVSRRRGAVSCALEHLRDVSVPSCPKQSRATPPWADLASSILPRLVVSLTAPPTTAAQSDATGVSTVSSCVVAWKLHHSAACDVCRVGPQTGADTRAVSRPPATAATAHPARAISGMSPGTHEPSQHARSATANLRRTSSASQGHGAPSSSYRSHSNPPPLAGGGAVGAVRRGGYGHAVRGGRGRAQVRGSRPRVLRRLVRARPHPRDG